MHKPIHSLELAALSLLLCVGAQSAFPASAQQLPPIPPTIAAPEPLLPVAKPVLPPRHRAQVDYARGSLKITADNSSLDEILSQIGKATGLKITGAVADESVFGTYGPADIASVLTRLLAGFAVNMLLRENGRLEPTELILSPRSGSLTQSAPSVRPQARQDTEDRPPDLAPHVDRPSEAPDPPADSALEDVPAASTLTPDPVTPEPDAPPPAPTTTQESPNGIKTPQQIYDQLLQLQKQNAPTAPR